MLRFGFTFLLLSGFSVPFALATDSAPAAGQNDNRTSVTVEQNPKLDLGSYISSGTTPKYIRINVPGYNIRKTPVFSHAKTDNIDFTTEKGALFAVKRMVPLDNGVAINITADGEDRWVYVPNSRRQDFQFCESEGCFSDLAQVLQFLRDQKISPENMAECGLTLNAQGDLMEPLKMEQVDAALEPYRAPAENPVVEPEVLNAESSEEKRPEAAEPEKAEELVKLPEGKDAPIPTFRPRPRPDREADKKEEVAKEPVASASRPRVSMLWEASRPSDGRQWTGFISKALDKFGQDMIRKTRLKDQAKWCPNYSRLSYGQRKEFYAHLLNGVARYESGFKTSLTFDEKTYTNPRSGRIRPDRHSQGLFQLSYSSASQRTYRNYCKFNYSRDKNKDLSNKSLTIYDPKLQIECAVGILNHWINKDGGISLGGKNAHRGGGRFWSTLRTNNSKTKLVRATLKRYTPCGLR
jgi:hypothetical protein